jgi:hypothetical protein
LDARSTPKVTPVNGNVLPVMERDGAFLGEKRPVVWTSASVALASGLLAFWIGVRLFGLDQVLGTIRFFVLNCGWAVGGFLTLWCLGGWWVNKQQRRLDAMGRSAREEWYTFLGHPGEIRQWRSGRVL